MATTLCRFCRGEDGPNPATTEIPAIGNGSIPVCEDCKAEWNEQTYQDWLAEQGPDERDMRDSNLDAVREIGI